MPPQSTEHLGAAACPRRAWPQEPHSWGLGRSEDWWAPESTLSCPIFLILPPAAAAAAAATASTASSWGRGQTGTRAETEHQIRRAFPPVAFSWAKVGPRIAERVSQGTASPRVTTKSSPSLENAVRTNRWPLARTWQVPGGGRGKECTPRLSASTDDRRAEGGPPCSHVARPSPSAALPSALQGGGAGLPPSSLGLSSTWVAEGLLQRLLLPGQRKARESEDWSG